MYLDVPADVTSPGTTLRDPDPEGSRLPSHTFMARLLKQAASTAEYIGRRQAENRHPGGLQKFLEETSFNF